MYCMYFIIFIILAFIFYSIAIGPEPSKYITKLGMVMFFRLLLLILVFPNQKPLWYFSGMSARVV